MHKKVCATTEKRTLGAMNGQHNGQIYFTSDCAFSNIRSSIEYHFFLLKRNGPFVSYCSSARWHPSAAPSPAKSKLSAAGGGENIIIDSDMGQLLRIYRLSPLLSLPLLPYIFSAYRKINIVFCAPAFASFAGIVYNVNITTH